jgi:cytochrome c peroxidase
MFPTEFSSANSLSAQAALGKRLFFETRLSTPRGQSCGTCHAAGAGFADPIRTQPTSNGAINWIFGPRNAPSAAYASFSPPLHWDPTRRSYIGGQFHDGRVDTLEHQAGLPFLNPLEMNQLSKRDVIDAMIKAGIGPQFRQVYGQTSLNLSTEARVNGVYDKITAAIAAYERSGEVNRFNSKFDQFLKGQVQLTALEQQGLQLFNGKGRCAFCHSSTIQGQEPAPLFTNFSYHNIGVPKNWMNPFLYLPGDLNPDGPDFVDLGLGNTVAEFYPEGAMWEDGKFKTPTLRNIAKTAPYGHNGFFKNLKEIVHFYNTRDVPGAGWPPSEVYDNLNIGIGNLGLTDQEENAIVAFLKTLTDQ